MPFISVKPVWVLGVKKGAFALRKHFGVNRNRNRNSLIKKELLGNSFQDKGITITITITICCDCAYTLIFIGSNDSALYIAWGLVEGVSQHSPTTPSL